MYSSGPVGPDPPPSPIFPNFPSHPHPRPSTCFPERSVLSPRIPETVPTPIPESGLPSYGRKREMVFYPSLRNDPLFVSLCRSPSRGPEYGTYLEFYWKTFQDASGSRCSRPPQDVPRVIHDIEFTNKGFFINGEDYRLLDDPKNESFLKSLRYMELPEEFKPDAGKEMLHTIIIRKDSARQPLSELLRGGAVVEVRKLPDEGIRSVWGPSTSNAEPQVDNMEVE